MPPLLNIWLIILISSIIFIIYLIFFLKYIGNLYEFSLKCFYFILTFILLVIYFFNESSILYKKIFYTIDEIFVIKDMQDLINSSFDLALANASYFSIPLIYFYIMTYFLNYSYKAQNYHWQLWSLFLFYYFLLFKFLIEEDIFLSSWNIFNNNSVLDYDFQPDFLFIILTYLGDFYDLSFFFLIMFFYYIILSKKVIFNYNLHLFLRIFFNSICSISMFYFFGGESLSLDFFLIGLTFVFLELLYICLLFFFKLKYKK